MWCLHQIRHLGVFCLPLMFPRICPTFPQVHSPSSCGVCCVSSVWLHPRPVPVWSRVDSWTNESILWDFKVWVSKSCIDLSHVAEALRSSTLGPSRAMVLLCGKHGPSVKEKWSCTQREQRQDCAPSALESLVRMVPEPQLYSTFT